MLPEGTLKFPYEAFGLIPETLNAIDVIMSLREAIGVIDAKVPEHWHPALYSLASNHFMRNEGA